MACQGFRDFSMARYGLGHFRTRIMVPVMPPSVAQQYATHGLEFGNQIFALHGTTNSPI